MSLFGPSWLTFACSVALSGALLGTVGFVKGCDYEKGKATVALLKATQEAREIEANWQTNLEAQNELDVEEKVRMAADYDRGLERLRNRAPVRMSSPSASSCAGASPEQLSRPDAELALRIAADADRTAAELRTCKAWVETVTGKH